MKFGVVLKYTPNLRFSVFRYSFFGRLLLVAKYLYKAIVTVSVFITVKASCHTSSALIAVSVCLIAAYIVINILVAAGESAAANIAFRISVVIPARMAGMLFTLITVAVIVNVGMSNDKTALSAGINVTYTVVVLVGMDRILV